MTKTQIGPSKQKCIKNEKCELSIYLSLISLTFYFERISDFRKLSKKVHRVLVYLHQDSSNVNILNNCNTIGKTKKLTLVECINQTLECKVHLRFWWLFFVEFCVFLFGWLLLLLLFYKYSFVPGSHPGYRTAFSCHASWICCLFQSVSVQ